MNPMFSKIKKLTLDIFLSVKTKGISSRLDITFEVGKQTILNYYKIFVIFKVTDLTTCYLLLVFKRRKYSLLVTTYFI
jgi:hypothetical protein